MTSDSQTASNKLTANVKSGGCAAKIGSAELKAIVAGLSKTHPPELIAGIADFDDAAVYKISDEVAIVQTIDFFPPLIDDPFLFGKIAATNALSDIYAMGARPIFALNVFCFPTCDFPQEVAKEILRGGASQVEAAGATIAGGHSIQSSEVIYGLAVTGLVAPSMVLTNGGAKAGDHLILTKPIGTGVALLGQKAGILSGSASKVLIDNLTTLNRNALTIAQSFPVHAATDVTGFGLIGHLHEMAQAAHLRFSLSVSRVLFLPEALKLASEGFLPAGTYGNRQSFQTFTTIGDGVDLAMADLLFDPQTAGGLLLAVSPDHSPRLTKALIAEGIQASFIGEFSKGKSGSIEVCP
ncbi:MAG: selenide, water dikinase SelD [Candidatus Melainabacteria bacterium]|nr:MAG: selenide, water dikinase SelD [Candidatus Melainabacteria bacterium]